MALRQLFSTQAFRLVTQRSLVSTAAKFATPVYSNHFQSSRYNFSGSGTPFKHLESEYNSESIPFEFNEANSVKVKQILAKYPITFQQGATIPLLHLAQEQEGWVSLSAMNKIAKIVGVPPMNVYEVATFYTMFYRDRVGKHVIGLCTTTPCMLCGSSKVGQAIKDHLQIDFGETTKDGLFTLLEVECLGACANAPMMQVGNDFYEDLTGESAVEVLKKFQNGEIPKPGPQCGTRRVAEPAGAKTSLFSRPTPPPLRTDGEL